jgi:hypothetical protein
MAFSGNAELKKVLELSDRTLKKVQKMVPKSRTLKSSRSSLKPLIVCPTTFVLECKQALKTYRDYPYISVEELWKLSLNRL